ncbi:HAMP domain-containing sensor histidine kinase [Halalkalibacter kiskunsagensis]|uniref:histidine kinase n=1 Tax=Halalkalibacter kiskunsagensis TaxID=1548599 RepID=A0ABV6KE59_9BACI
MKDLRSAANKKLYNISMGFIIVFMLLGLVVVFLRSDVIGWGFYVQVLLVIVLSTLLLLYPKKETNYMKTFIIVVTMFYFYTLFIMYPETSSTLLLICLIPGVSILFFLPKLFYLSLIINGLLMTFIFSYIFFSDHGKNYPHIYDDLIGNLINFFASQALLFLIFYLTYTRMRKQQLYYQQIQQAERFKTTGQLAAAVAHEIRNPITVVKGFVQLYKEDQSIPKQTKEHFSLMLDELHTAELVISDFLSIAKTKEQGEVNIINVSNCLHSVVELIYSYALLHNVKIKVDVEEGCYISCSLMEMKQLFINLLKNAIEASPFGGTLLLEARMKNRFVEVNVIDSGNGMTAEELKQIGTPFYSLKSKGTGLGLTICFNIAHKYNGTIHFTSELGKGTKVKLQFPAKKDQNENSHVCD